MTDKAFTHVAPLIVPMADDQHPLRLLMRGYEDKYPHKLVKDFSRVTNRIVELWNDPAAMEEYFHSLLVMDRHDRKGFPPDVAAEIFSLNLAYDVIRARKAEASADLWGTEQEAKEELERLRLQPTIANFARAAEAGDVSSCKLFLSANLNVDVRDTRHWTPLMIASFNGREELAQMLIQHGADVRACDQGGYTPMHWAAFNGYAELIKLLLAKGGAVNAQSHVGITPLIQAAARGHVATTAELLKGRADPNLAANDGGTPLFKAISNGHLEIVNLLLEAGASLNATMQNGATLVGSAKLARDPKIRDRIAAAVYALKQQTAKRQE
ncbi:conserved protein of unknown function [Georgfuchsia toluolica]|uniref:Ankyrin repeat domain-containing protein n=1 Tax=Georgfuchsia toluolica TaxID=424218 RepID=A0A916J6E3_9PROT|nr:ankyrin repeat domain-containing protein [Georgfuchsia toluolica]CAG4884821.1 conserved protein of unknown function [Georgfuchsia toluolica]